MEDGEGLERDRGDDKRLLSRHWERLVIRPAGQPLEWLPPMSFKDTDRDIIGMRNE